MKRLTTLVVVILSIATIIAGASHDGRLMAQTSEDQAVEALQTQVADQGQQIATLQSQVDALTGSVALLTSNVATMLASSAEKEPELSNTPAPTQTPETFEIVGTVALDSGLTGDRNFIIFEFQGEDLCSGTGGFDDITAGMQIVVEDTSGRILGSATLDYGHVEDGDCVFDFSIQVPRSEFYTLTSGRRGSLTYSFEDLENSNWGVALTLG